jgi:hypothetical protein
MLDDTSPLADVVAVPADPLHGLPVCRRYPTRLLGSGTSPPLRGAICVYALEPAGSDTGAGSRTCWRSQEPFHVVVVFVWEGYHLKWSLPCRSQAPFRVVFGWEGSSTSSRGL